MVFLRRFPQKALLALIGFGVAAGSLYVAGHLWVSIGVLAAAVVVLWTRDPDPTVIPASLQEWRRPSLIIITAIVVFFAGPPAVQLLLGPAPM